ncbi:MAG: hypothetical protein WCP69_02095 [Bacteroidota bacterium]
MNYSLDLSENDFEFSWINLKSKEMEYQIGLKTLRNLIISQDLSLAKIKENFEQSIIRDKTLNSLDPNNKANFYEDFYNEQEQILDEIDIIQRYSMCVSCFSFFESRLKELCELIESNFKLDLKIEDLYSKSDILRYWIFLVKVFKISVTENLLFNSITDKKDVRNIIIHQNGISNSKQLKKIKSINGIHLSALNGQTRIVMIGSQFNNDLLCEIEKFFSVLLKAIDERYKEMSVEGK